MRIDPNNPVVKLCAEGIQVERFGDKTKFADLYRKAWKMKSDEACIAAHYMARVQENLQNALLWNQEASRFPGKLAVKT